MKRRLIILTATLLSISLLAGCGQAETTGNAETQTTEASTESTATQEQDVTQTPEPTAEPTPAPTEEPTPEPTEEPTPAPTEEPTPAPTEEPTPEPTEEPVVQITYTYTDMTTTMYATQTVNIRNLPSTDGDKVGSLSTNQEVAVTGQCNETGWYRFDYNGQTAFVSDKYLSTEMVEVAPPADNGGGESASANVPNPYELPLQTWIDYGNWFLYIQPSLDCPEYDTSSAFWHDKDAILKERNPDCMTLRGLGIKLDNGTWSAWMVTEGYGDQYPFPETQQEFLRIYQY